MKKILYSLSFLFLINGQAFPQSIFSALENSIGLRNYSTTIRGLGMGGTGLALLDSNALNAYNIASWRDIHNTKINISMYYTYQTTSVLAQDFSSSTARFNGLQLGIPIKKNRGVVGISISPYSQVNFSYIFKYQTPERNYDQNVFYEGNIARGQLNLAWAINKKVGFGASLNYFFGTINDRYFLFFNNAAISDDYYEIDYQLRGPGLGLSMDVVPVNQLRIGGFIDFKTRLKYNQIYQSPITFTEERTEKKAILPLFLGIGSCYQFKNNWQISADAVFQNWSEGLQLGTNPANLEDFYQAGLGIEHSHSRKRTRNLFNKLDTRAGFSYGSTGYRITGASITEYSGSFGLGIPFFQGNARLDVAIIAGIRGDKSKTLAEEKFIKLFLAVNAGELWFQRIR